MGPKFTKPAIPNSEDEVSSTSGRKKNTSKPADFSVLIIMKILVAFKAKHSIKICSACPHTNLIDPKSTKT